MPIIVLPYYTSRSLYSSFLARMSRKSVRLESQVVLSASLILYASESVLYCVLAGFICIETDTYLQVCSPSLVFLVLEFIAWFICGSQQQRLPVRLTNPISCESV